MDDKCFMRDAKPVLPPAVVALQGSSYRLIKSSLLLCLPCQIYSMFDSYRLYYNGILYRRERVKWSLAAGWLRVVRSRHPLSLQIPLFSPPLNSLPRTVTWGMCMCGRQSVTLATSGSLRDNSSFRYTWMGSSKGTRGV